MSKVNIAVEGATDEAIIRKTLLHIDLECGLVQGLKGKGHLVNNLFKYNRAAKFQRWLVVIDLDKNPCPVTYRNELLPNTAENLIFRIAVHEIEAWLLADREAIADYLNIPIANFPMNPDDEEDPKRTLVNIVRRKSRSKKLRADMIPLERSGRSVGMAYPSRIIEFTRMWRPEVAAQNSESLRRCLKALEAWQ